MTAAKFCSHWIDLRAIPIASTGNTGKASSKGSGIVLVHTVGVLDPGRPPRLLSISVIREGSGIGAGSTAEVQKGKIKGEH